MIRECYQLFCLGGWRHIDGVFFNRRVPWSVSCTTSGGSSSSITPSSREEHQCLDHWPSRHNNHQEDCETEESM